MFRILITLSISFALTAQARAGSPAQAPQHEVTDDFSYDDLIRAGAAAEILRFELSMGAPPRLAAASALLAAFADRNPNASPQQLGAYAAAIDAELMSAFPSDPDLARSPHLLPAIRFASARLSAPELGGTDTRVGDDALALLDLLPDPGARSLRAVDFERVQAVDFANNTLLANLITGMMLGQTPDGNDRDGLAEAMESLAALHGIDLTPADLAVEYPEISLAMNQLPADFASFDAERTAGFVGLQGAIDAEFVVLRGRIDASLVGITDVLLREPDQFLAAGNAQDPVLLAQLQQQQIDDLLERTTSRTMLSLNSLLIAQSDSAAEREYARQARSFSDIQLQTDSTMSDVEAGLEIGGNVLNALGSFATGNPLGGIGSLLSAIGGIFGMVEPSVPTPEQQIFDQIIELRQQVEDLRVEMNARFDSIDRQLDIIYQAMSSGLNQLNETTRRIDGNVQQISIDLYELRSALTSLEANLYGVLSAGFEQGFIQDMETALTYRQRTGVDLEFTGQGDNTFFAFHSRFYARATTIATDEVYAGPAGVTLMNDGSAAAQLTSFPLGYNINNLRQFPSQLGLPLWSFGRVANPTTWSLAADAYAQLARENPWYFAKLHENDPTRLGQVIATGESTRNMMRGARDRTLIETIVNQYTARVDALDLAIGLANFLFGAGYEPGLDPWGGVTQDMTGVGPALTEEIAIYDGVSFTNAVPWFDSRIIWEVFDPRFGLAIASGLPGWPQDRLRVQFHNISSASFPPATHFMVVWIQDADAGYLPHRRYLATYSWPNGEPLDVFQWILTHGEAVEFLLRATTDGESATIDGYTIQFHLGYEGWNIEFVPPSTPSVEQRLTEIQDEYWIDTTNALSSSTTLDLLDSLTSSEELLAAYVAIGMPETIEQNDLVRAALRGSASEFSGLGGRWLTQPFQIAGAAGVAPPTIDSLLIDRGALLLAQLGPALDSPDHESHAYIEWSLESLYDLESNAFDLCIDDTYAVAPDTALSVDVAAGVMTNDAQQPGASAISTALIFPATNGSVSLNADGSFTYTPSPGFVGTDAFRYIATANLSEPGDPPNLITANPATVVIVVSAAPPVCIADLTSQNAPVGDPNYGVPDGLVTGADIQFYVNAWIAGDASIADLTTQNAPVGDPNYGVPDGIVTGADIQFYVNLWIIGCP